MTNQASITGLKGRAFLLKLDITGASPTVFTSLTGLRATNLKLNGNQVDISNKNSNGWQELLSDAGIRKIDMSASGLYDGAASGVFAFMEKAAIANTFIDCQMIFGNGVTLTGTFAISDYTIDGPYDNAQTFSINLMSHGPVVRAGN